MRITAEKRSKVQSNTNKKTTTRKPLPASAAAMKAPVHRTEVSASSEGTCSNCGADEKCRYRTFSEQAWTVLLVWNEINPRAVERPICDECYTEMREILIERSHDIELALKQTTDDIRKTVQSSYQNVS